MIDFASFTDGKRVALFAGLGTLVGHLMRKSVATQMGLDFGEIDPELFRAAIAESDNVKGVATDAEIDSVVALLLAQTDEQIRLILKDCGLTFGEPKRVA
jgi:hypothetical protein